VPPTLNLDDPEPSELRFEHVRQRETGPIGRLCQPELRAALCNSFGFGGMNASVSSQYVRVNPNILPIRMACLRLLRYAYIFIHTRAHTYKFIYIYSHAHTHTHTHYIYIYIYIYVYIYLST